MTAIALLVFSHLATASSIAPTMTSASPPRSASTAVVRAEYIILDPESIAIDLNPKVTSGIYRQYTANNNVIFSYCTANNEKLHLGEERSEATILELELKDCRAIGRKQGYSKAILDAILRDLNQQSLGNTAKKLGGVVLGQVIGIAAGYLVGRQLKMQNPWMVAGIAQLVGITSAFYLQDYSSSYLSRQAFGNVGAKQIKINENLTLCLSSITPSYSELIKGIAFLDNVYSKYESQQMN